MNFEKNVNYIVIEELPEDQQEPFSKWLYGQTVPIIESEGDHHCAYKWDYDLWLEQFHTINKTK